MDTSTLRLLFLFALALGASGVLPSTSAAADLPVIADTYTDTAAPGTNYGGYGITAVARTRVSLIRFDSKTIALARGDTATLHLNVRTIKNWKDGIALHLVQAAWDEKKVTAATLPLISPIVLDERIITATDQGTTINFDISGALSVWRNDPSKNFGIAIVSTSPLSNLEIFSREMKAGATLSIGGETAGSDELWIGGAQIQQVRSNGEVVRTLAAAPARQQYADFVNDPLTGGLWVESYTTNLDEPYSATNTDHIVRLGPTGTVEVIIDVQAPRNIMVDPRDGGIWVAHLWCDNGCYPDSFGEHGTNLLKFDRQGNQVAKVTGFDFPLAVMQMNRQTGVMWLRESMGGGDGPLYRVSGSDQELNGYSIQGSGPHHTFFPGYFLALAVNPNDDGQGQGNIWWADNNYGQLVKGSAPGADLARVPAVGYFDPIGTVEVNELTGSAIACVVDESRIIRYAVVSPSGVQSSIPLNPPYDLAPNVLTVCNRQLLLDPYHGLSWTSAWQRVGSGWAYSVVALNGAGHAVRVFDRGSKYPYNMALRRIDVRVIVVTGGAALDPKQVAPLTMGVLSRGDFDALQVDPGSARLGPSRAAPTAFRAKDLDGDGRPDLAMDFSLPATGIACGNSYAGLTAANYQGVAVAGNAKVSVQGCH